MRTKSLLGLICFFSLVACSPKNSNTTQLPPTEALDYLASFLDTSVDSGDYGTVTTSTTKIFSFKNVGDTSGSATPTITGTNATAFSIILQTGCGTVNVNSSCTVRVNFNPSGKVPSTYNAILSVGGTTKTLSAIVGAGSTSGGGSGVIEATISDVIIDNPLDFGTFSGTQTSTKTIKLTNKGTSSIGPLSAALSDTDFSFLINSCVSKTLAPNAFCSVRVSFNATGKMAQEYLTDLTFGTSSFPLKATVSSGGTTTTGGTTSGGASNLTILEGLNPITTPVEYGTLTGSQSLTKIFTIKNTGTSNIIVNPILNNTNFTMILNSCSNKNLLPNGSCSIRVGFSAKNKIDQEYLSTITVVTGSTIELKATVSGSQGGGIVYTYDPVYSAYGTCSADLACEGVGSQTRTITQCNRFQDGAPAGVGTLADCASFNIPLNTTQTCFSPQGNVTSLILGGEQVFSCPAGSTVQTFESVSCNSGYHINGQICEADANIYSLTIQNGTTATITDGAGIFCDENCASQVSNFSENTLVNLQLSYPSNYRFLGWTGACSGTGAICSLTMTTNLTVGVNLELISPPSGLTLTINNGDSYTNSLGVSLMLSAADTEEMKISDGTGCANGTWEPFSETKNYMLNSLNALVDISFMTRNAGGESECVSSSITHDDITPVVTYTNTQNEVIVSENVPYFYDFNFTITDTNLPMNFGVKEYSQENCQGSFSSLGASSFSSHMVSLDIGDIKSIAITVQDLAGNTTELCSPSVELSSCQSNEYWDGNACQPKTYIAGYPPNNLSPCDGTIDASANSCIQSWDSVIVDLSFCPDTETQQSPQGDDSPVLITNGSSIMNCDLGQSTGTIRIECDPGFEESNGECVEPSSSVFFIGRLTSTNQILEYDPTSSTIYDILDSFSSNYKYQTSFNGRVIYTGTSAGNQNVYTYDGTQWELIFDAGTSGSIHNIRTINNQFMFTYNDGVSGRIKFVVITSNSWTPVVYTMSGTGGSGFGQVLGSTSAHVYLSGNNGTNGLELYVYDGVNAPVLVDIYPGANGSSPSTYSTDNSTINNKFYFYGITASGTDVYSAQGTTLTKETSARSFGAETLNLSSAGSMVVFKNKVVYAAQGRGLFQWDPSNNSVALLMAPTNPNIVSQTNFAVSTSFARGNYLFLKLYVDGSLVAGHYLYDGTTIQPALYSGNTAVVDPPSSFVEFNNRYFVLLNNALHFLNNSTKFEAVSGAPAYFYNQRVIGDRLYFSGQVSSHYLHYMDLNFAVTNVGIFSEGPILLKNEIGIDTQIPWDPNGAATVTSFSVGSIAQTTTSFFVKMSILVPNPLYKVYLATRTSTGPVVETEVTTAVTAREHIFLQSGLIANTNYFTKVVIRDLSGNLVSQGTESAYRTRR